MHYAVTASSPRKRDLYAVSSKMRQSSRQTSTKRVVDPRWGYRNRGRVRSRPTSLRQRNELLVVSGDGIEAPGLPVGLGLFDPLGPRGDEVPPDVPRPVHRGAAEENDTRVGHGGHRNAVTRTQDQQPTGAEPVAGNVDFAGDDIDRALLGVRVKRTMTRRARAPPRQKACATGSSPAQVSPSRLAGNDAKRLALINQSRCFRRCHDAQNVASISSSAAGNPSQHCRYRAAARQPGVRSARCARVDDSAAGRHQVDFAWLDRRSRCRGCRDARSSPSKRYVTVASPICGCGRTSIPCPVWTSAGPK